MKTDKLVSGFLSSRLGLKVSRYVRFPRLIPKRLLPILLNPTLDVVVDRVRFKIFDPTYCHHKVVHAEGGYEYPVTKHILANISKGDVFIDVGAFYGYYTLFVARALAGSGHIFSFEPNKEYFDIVDKNLQINDISNGVHLHNIALSNRRGTVIMGSSESDQNDMNKWRGPLKRQMKIVDDEQALGMKGIETISFDEFADRNDISPDFIKIDVHGAEGRVLEGMKKTLEKKKVKHLYCEVHPPQIGIIGGYTVEDVANLIRDSGMEVSEFKNYRQRKGEIVDLERTEISECIMLYAKR